MDEPAIKKAISVLKALSRDPETVRIAELRMKQILDEKSMIEGAKEEGKTEGRLEGKLESKREIARSALEKGADVDFVSSITGLAADELEEIEKEIRMR